MFSCWESRTTKDIFITENIEKLCERAVFRAPNRFFEQLMTRNCKGNMPDFIENLSILRLTLKYRDKVLEILPKSEDFKEDRVSTYDAIMNGKRCVLKLYLHSEEEILKANASKTVRLRKEIEIVKVLNALAEPCPNLVQLLGSSIEAPMHMIIERGSKGDLLTYLNKHLNKHLNVTEAQTLVQIALDICNAMIVLDSQNIIHRDLCAKNCFVFMQYGKLLVKIGDFHLAAVSYPGPRSPTGTNSATSVTVADIFSRFAVPWMAVETLQFGEFSTASDVWSYGVLLSEIFTFGSQPYVNMPSGLSLTSDEDIREYVTNGKKLELHSRIPESIQVLIQSTMENAELRPTFLKLKDNLLKIDFEDETYADASYFQISHHYGNTSADTSSRASASGCTANGCFGECLSASDVAVPFVVDGSHFVKEFIPATSYDILQLSELKCPSLAIITGKIFHDEKIELTVEVGDKGNLRQSIDLQGCSKEIGHAMRYLLQIGKAVSFLHDKRFIHRNLRANSVFVYSDGTAKLACFARVRKLKRNTEDKYSTKPIHLPMPNDSLRWSSPEVILDGEYSKASDMWAFGVLIWEMFTLLDKDLDESDEEITPYHELSSKEQIISCLQEEKRLDKPDNCPDWLYEMMLQCWEYNAHNRAKAQDIVNCINEQISKY